MEGPREVTTACDELAKIFTLRVTAWRGQATLLPGVEKWQDEHDEHGRHWAMFFDGEPIAAARLCVHARVSDLPDAEVYAGLVADTTDGLPIASYNRLVVHPTFRGRGISRLLDDVCIAAARDSGACILLGATGSVVGNRPRIDAMRRRGFVSLGVGRAFVSAPYVTHAAPTVLALHLRGPRRD